MERRGAGFSFSSTFDDGRVLDPERDLDISLDLDLEKELLRQVFFSLFSDSSAT
jgi:hypothetical protein